jgi:hypothetical protein
VRLSDQTLCDLKGIGSGGSLRVRYSHPQAELFMMCRPASSMVFGRVPEVVSATGRSEVRVGVFRLGVALNKYCRNDDRSVWCTIGPALISASASAEALAFTRHESSERLT